MIVYKTIYSRNMKQADGNWKMHFGGVGDICISS